MNITEIFQNMLMSVGNMLPGILGALAVLIIGWLIAKAFKGLVYRVLKKSTWDDKLFGKTDIDSEKFISKLVYYIIMVMVLLVVLEMLGVSEVLDPLKDMVGKFMTFLPNLVAALAIGFVGYIIASVVSELVNLAGNLLDTVSSKVGIDSKNLANILKKIVFIVILIPILIAALDALNIDAISGPAKEMLSEIFNILPNLIACVLIIGFFYVGGRFITGLVKDLLISLGTDNLSSKLGVGNLIGHRNTLSGIASSILFFFIVYIGVITGVERLGFVQLNNILHSLLEWGGQILFGLIILAIGNFLANFAYDTMKRTDGNDFIAKVVRIALLGLFLAISLRSMGFANEIVNLAFGLVLGSVAVVVALAYGLGGREAAGKHMEEIIGRFKK